MGGPRFNALPACASGGPHPFLDGSGKVYNVLASAIASAICTEVPEVREASVLLVSRIGQLLSEPWIGSAEVVPARRLTKSIQTRVAALVARKLDSVEEVTRHLIAGETKVY